MRIVCPSCAAEYDVADRALAPGRATRCARCGTEWKPLGAAPEPPPIQPSPPPPSRFSPPPAPVLPHEESRPRFIEAPPARLRRKLPTATLAWAASLIVLAALAWGAYAGRTGIVAAWPPSIRVYHALGLR